MITSRHDVRCAVGLFAVLFVIYNANGREIGSYDSQPTKLAARQLLLRGTLALNYVVGATPQYLERPAFVLARDGRYRSAYSPVPAIVAAAIMWPLWKLGLVDVRAPLAPNLIAALAASVLTALAAALAFLTARQRLSRGQAIMLSFGLGVGTGLWSSVSQTLWQHETAIFGLSLAVYGLAMPSAARSRWPAVLVGVGLGLASASRLQLAPAVSVLMLGAVLRGGWRFALVSAAVVACFVAPLVVVNIRWFGSALGAAPMLEALHGTVHRTSSTFAWQVEGFAGLLFSPSRGLFVFSPVVFVALLGVRRALTDGWRSPVRWCALAAAAQYSLYSVYSVWWGGHTYGPRYMLDVLPLLVPLAAAGLEEVGSRAARHLAVITLGWSITVAATGAFFYPNDNWNGSPVDVDRAQERLWEWRDNQVARCWRAGPSPQNFNLFTRDAVRRPADNRR